MRRGIRSIHSRLFLLFLVSTLGLLLVLSFTYYKRSTHEIHQRAEEFAQKNMTQTVQLLDLIMHGYDSFTKTVISNSDLQRLLGNDPDKDAALLMIRERTIVNMLGRYYYSREDLIGLHVLTPEGAVYSYSGNFQNDPGPQFQTSDWYTRLEETTGEMIWFGVHDKSLIDQNWQKPVFTFGRKLYDLNNRKPIGILLIETNPDPILSALNNLSLGSKGIAYLLDPQNHVAASAQDRSENTASPQTVVPVSAEEVARSNPNDLILTGKTSVANWTIVSVASGSDMNVELAKTKNFLLIVGSILLFVSTVIASIVSRTFSHPFKKLIRQMKQVQMGNFRGKVEVNSYEEINSLVHSFNEMVLRIDELVSRVKTVSTSEKNAQLMALQSQVNPHFLYNTLDMIYWMLDEREDHKLGDVILSLSRMFRYSSDWERAAEVTLGDELEQIRHYLTIIQTRFEGRLQAQIDIPEAFLNAKMPKMTLQPIIENAVKYGVEPQNRIGKLAISASAEGQTLFIRIRDNGMGMDEGTLLKLQEALCLDRGEMKKNAGSHDILVSEGETFSAVPAVYGRRTGGIGLLNVHRRLVLMFGAGCGITVESGRGAGTVVTVAIPARLEGGAAA